MLGNPGRTGCRRVASWCLAAAHYRGGAVDGAMGGGGRRPQGWRAE
jgi:hypothetical protein